MADVLKSQTDAEIAEIIADSVNPEKNYPPFPQDWVVARQVVADLERAGYKIVRVAKDAEPKPAKKAAA